MGRRKKGRKSRELKFSTTFPFISHPHPDPKDLFLSLSLLRSVSYCTGVRESGILGLSFTLCKREGNYLIRLRKLRGTGKGRDGKFN